MLDIVMALDRLRDASENPSDMFSGIVKYLAGEFHAGLTLLAVRNPTSAQLELKAVADSAGLLSNFGEEAVKKVAEYGLTEFDEITLFNRGDTLPVVGESPFEMAVVPVFIGTQERLGLLLLARPDETFTQQEVELLRVAESQIDSAVIQGYAFHELQMRNRELEIIYRIDHIRDQQLVFEDMLNAVLGELRSIVEAQAAFIMLYDNSGERLEMRGTTADDMFTVVDHVDYIEQVAYETLEAAELIFHNHTDHPIQSIMCIPLILGEQILGVFGLVNRKTEAGFDEDDRRLLKAIGSQIDTAIFESIEKRRLRTVLGRSVDPNVMARLLANPNTDCLAGERRTVTVLYADIRGSTRLAEEIEPEMLVSFINDYLTNTSNIILHEQGTIDKFVGDEVMALWNAPFDQHDHAVRAVRAARALQQAHSQLVNRWQSEGLTKAVGIGVGIATGEMIAGEMGSTVRSDYTVIGRAANLGSRICARAEAGEVLISQKTLDLVGDGINVEQIPTIDIRGIGTVDIYRLLD